MEEQPKKSTHIVLIIVITICLLSISYFGIEGYCAINKIEIPESVQNSLTHIGATVTGALIGLLVNTQQSSKSLL